jgi:hypothetical protein
METQQIKIIIVGGCKTINGYPIDLTVDATEWNNPNQASHYALIMLLQKYNIKEISCYDYLYPNNNDETGIKYHKKGFLQVEADLNLNEECHNIVIEFCNFYHEDWTSDGLGKPFIESKYKVSWLSCGCMWKNGFPFDAIDKIIQEKLYTPFDSMNVDSYITSIIYSSSITEEFMKPFMNGVYQVLGSVMFRGCSATNYTCEEPLRQLFTLIETPLNQKENEEFNRFLDGSIHWNTLPHIIKQKITQLIYRIDY